jgi:hypothetical protein
MIDNEEYTYKIKEEIILYDEINESIFTYIVVMERPS